jgi:hypothetical protein
MYNLVYLIFSLWALIYADTYINMIFIPDSFRWKDGKLRDDLTFFDISQIAILILETIILLLIIYFINKWYLANIVKTNNNRTIALWTGGIFLLIELVFMSLLIYWSSKA